MKLCLMQMNVQQPTPCRKGGRQLTDTSLFPQWRPELQARLEKVHGVPGPHPLGLQHHSTYIKTSKTNWAWPQMYLGDSRRKRISDLCSLHD